MNKYKPEYLGKVIPADDQEKLTDFCQNRYDAFTTIYDACKDSSNNIQDIRVVDGDTTSLSVKISTEESTLDDIREKIKDNDSITMNNDMITVKV